MKKHLCMGLLLCFSMQVLAGTPKWVKQRPVSQTEYIGIGMCSKTEPDYMKLAKEAALNDLASEIKVNIQSSSLLNTLTNATGGTSDYSIKSIRMSVAQDLENYQLIDTWQDKKSYWIYYKLTKKDYEELIKLRNEKIARIGAELLESGKRTAETGDLTRAADYLSQGLQSLLPAANEELIVNDKNIGIELYKELSSLLQGLEIKISPKDVVAEPFSGVVNDIKVQCFRKGTRLKNVKVKAAFSEGGGNISGIAQTNEKGLTSFRINNITSKDKQQQIRVYIEREQFASIFNLYKKYGIVSTFTEPEAFVTVSLEDATNMKAYIKADDSFITQLTTMVSSLLSNNYFDIVEDENEADVIVTLKSDFDSGKNVRGELYEMKEAYTSASVILTKRENKTVLMNYAIQRLRTVAPDGKTKGQVKDMAVRDLMKRLQRELNIKLKNINKNK